MGTVDAGGMASPVCGWGGDWARDAELTDRYDTGADSGDEDVCGASEEGQD